MKKIIRLMIPIGLVAIIFIILYSYVQASDSSIYNSITIGEGTKTEQIGPPWFDAAWNYRRPLIISNGGTNLPYYQVLVTLNNINFNFNQAKEDGSDVRFTHSDGTTELKFWIESWDKTNQKAYIWVRVPSLASGDTIIYLYYNNPTAASLSDGNATFDGFDDDWSKYTTAGFNLDGETQGPQLSNQVESPFGWSTISGSPVASSGILSLVNGTGIKSLTTYQYQAVGFRVNFGSGAGHSGAGHEWVGFNIGDIGKGTMIGDLISDQGNLYLMNYVIAENNTLLPRIGGIDWHNAYHVYEVRWKSGWSEGDIDHGISKVASTTQVPSSPPQLPVTLYNYLGSNATLMVDWIYLRQYRDPEPTSYVSPAQGLVDLSISMVDFHDPLPTGAELTYQITVTNYSGIEAPGVLVTDTLPASVQYVRANPPTGCNQAGDGIICNLNTISAFSTGSVSIVVQPTIDRIITNTVTVGSLGYDLDTSNNWGEVTTLVDSIPPNVNWEKPVYNGQDYSTYGGFIELAASATDNNQVSWVEFLLYDHLDPDPNPVKRWKSQGIDYAYPYQIQFDSNILVPNVRYQMFVRAADTAGNISNPLDPLRAIYVQRTLLFFDYLSIIWK